MFDNENNHPFILLSKDDIAEALEDAGLRNKENEDVSDSSDYDGLVGRLPLSSEEAQRRAVIGEYAAHDWFNVPRGETRFFVPKNQYAGLKKAADLTWNGRKVEVRNCVEEGNPCKVALKDIKCNAIVVQVHVEVDEAGEYTGRVYFLGWVDSAVAQKTGRKKYTPTGYYYAKSVLNHMDALGGVAA